MATLFLHLGSEGRNIYFAPGAASQRGLIATNGHTQWLSFDRHSTLVSDRGFRYDKRVFLQAVQVLRQPNPQIQVVYQTSEVAEPTLSVSEGDGVDIQTVGDQVVVGGVVAEPTVFDVQLRVDGLTTHLSLHLFPRERVFMVALDAGSESSQMLIHSLGNEEQVQRHLIMDGLRRHFGIPEGEYDQEDEDAHLYLSRFYWNRQNEQAQGSHFCLPNATSPLLFITRRSDTNKALLPAVKVHFLSSLTHSRPWTVQKIYQSLLAKFLMEALYQIAEGHPNERVAVVVNLLVPNMLSQNDHAALSLAMNQFVQSPRFNELKPQGFDGYVEVRLVSESDASLLGFLEQKDRQQNGRYCVVDCGKGTTDISVVDVDTTKATAIARVGFLGAGNIINQAIFQEAVLHFVPLNEYHAKMEALLGLEPAKLWRLEKAVERLKRLIHPAAIQDAATIPDLEPDTLIQKIEGLAGIPTTYNMLNNAIDNLVTEVVKRVPDKIDIICLTGRAFLFAPLRERMIAALRKRTKHINFDAASAKEVCLLGTLATRKLDANRIGVPIAYDCTKGMGGPTLRERVSTCVQPCKGWFSLGKISSTRKIIEDWFNGERPVRNKEEVQPAQVAKVVDENEVMRGGTPIHCFGAGTRFRLGDVVYHADLPNEGEMRLFFDGAQFFVRTAESRYLLQKVMARASDQRFLAESLFPYGMQFDTHLITYGDPQINTQQS